MSETVGDFLVDRLHAWGVRRIFGYPGDGINGVFGALNRAEGKDRVHSGPARRNGRIHGVRACQIYRRTGRVHRDVRSRRLPSLDWPI